MRRLSCLIALSAVSGCFSPNASGDATAGTDGSTGGTDETAGGSVSGTAGSEDASSTADGSGTGMGSAGVCGDGVVDDGEVCDDGINDGGYGGCASDCQSLGPHCGDGEEQPSEACDDGNTVDGDGCNTDCIVSGTALWTETYHEGEADRGQAMAINPDDEILVVAWAGDSTSNEDFSNWLRLYDTDGATLLTDDNPAQNFIDVDFTSEGDIVTSHAQAGAEDNLTRAIGKFSADWTPIASVDFPNAHWTHRVHATPDGGLVVGGRGGFDSDQARGVTVWRWAAA